MMRTTYRIALLAAVMAVGTLSHATDSFSSTFDHLSAFQDTSNLFSSGANFQVEFSHSGPDTLFIDGVNFSGDTADLNLPTTFLSYADPFSPIYDSNNPSQFTYNFGDAISGDQTWRFNQVASLFGSSSASVGEHDFTMNFMGHYGADPTGVLMALNCALVVAPKLDITVTGTTSPSTISSGQQSAMDMTVTNNMLDHAFVSTTWFVSGMSSSGHYLNLDNFDFSPDSTGWFNKTLLTGESLTRGHSFWSANGSTPSGVYSGQNGVVGGLFNGDWNFVSMSNSPMITVRGASGVPGPAAASSMGLGWLLLALRRRRSRK